MASMPVIVNHSVLGLASALSARPGFMSTYAVPASTLFRYSIVYDVYSPYDF